MTPDALEAAHALAVRYGVYQPLSAEAQAAANGYAPQSSRPTPPPLLTGSNPEISHAAISPYDMSLQDLRKAAMRQQLEGGGPNYR